MSEERGPNEVLIENECGEGRKEDSQFLNQNEQSWDLSVPH